jgi:threonine/homoserine/homoserine lactone efflux protein
VDVRFLAFLLVSTALIVSPGPDMALVTRNALRDGRRSASLTAWGVATGLTLWGIAAAAGVAAILASSAIAFLVLKLAGALYLTVLGARSLIAALRDRGAAQSAAPAPRSSRNGGLSQAFWQGLLNNLLNPKAAVIFVSVFPQFMRPGDPALRLLAMVAVFSLLTLGWLHVYGAAVARAGHRIGRSARRVLDAVAGLVMIGLGVRLAVEPR